MFKLLFQIILIVYIVLLFFNILDLKKYNKNGIVRDCETIEEVFDRVMQTAVSQYGEVLVGSVVEQLWSDYSLNSYYKHREE